MYYMLRIQGLEKNEAIEQNNQNSESFGNKSKNTNYYRKENQTEEETKKTLVCNTPILNKIHARQKEETKQTLVCSKSS